MDLDLTFLAQLGILLFLLATLQGVLFKPFLRVLEARHKKLEGAREEIEKLTRVSAEDLEAYQTRIRQARDVAQKERDVLRDEGRDKERKMLTEVRADITRELNGARERVSAAEQEARQKLAAETEALAKRMVERVLGREVA